jgi:uncharacterized protein (DUF1330 family)
MPAYFIAIRESVHDPEEMKTYGEKAGKSVAGRTITPRAVYGRFKLLEGSGMESAVIMEFPTFEEAEAWYDSPEYQDAVQHRFRGAKYRAFIVDGV